MARHNNPDSASREFQTVFRFGDVTYVPHYRNSSVFVGPGYPRFTKERFSEEELIQLGASKQKSLLWTRGNHGTVSDSDL
jgi:hypothetical protein